MLSHNIETDALRMSATWFDLVPTTKLFWVRFHAQLKVLSTNHHITSEREHEIALKRFRNLGVWFYMSCCKRKVTGSRRDWLLYTKLVAVYCRPLHDLRKPYSSENWSSDTSSDRTLPLGHEFWTPRIVCFCLHFSLLVLHFSLLVQFCLAYALVYSASSHVPAGR